MPSEVFRLSGEAALVAVGGQRDVVELPVDVVQGVDLDDVRAEVAEHLGAEGAGDGEAEVERP